MLAVGEHDRVPRLTEELEQLRSVPLGSATSRSYRTSW
jgi:hypothetical protein